MGNRERGSSFFLGPFLRGVEGVAEEPTLWARMVWFVGLEGALGWLLGEPVSEFL